MPSPTAAGDRPTERVRNTAQLVYQAPLPTLVASAPSAIRRTGPRFIVRQPITFHATLNRVSTIHESLKHDRQTPQRRGIGPARGAAQGARRPAAAARDRPARARRPREPERAGQPARRAPASPVQPPA